MISYRGNGSYCYSNSASMLLSTIGEDVSPSLIEVLTGFSLAAIRAQDFAIYFNNQNGIISTLKEKQSRLFGKCQTLATLNHLDDVADTLKIVADIEDLIRTSILDL